MFGLRIKSIKKTMTVLAERREQQCGFVRDLNNAAAETVRQHVLRQNGKIQ
jgi:hypothetical protein